MINAKNENPSKIGNLAVPGALAALAGLVFSVGSCSRKEIPEGSIGLDFSRAGKLVGPSKVEALPSGTYLFGSIRFPNLKIAKPGDIQDNSARIELTPGTWDKIVTAGQKSVLWNMVPIASDLLKEGVTQHLEVDINIRLTLPKNESEIVELYKKVGSPDPTLAMLGRCKSVLSSKEDALNRRFFKPKISDVEKALQLDLEEEFSVKGVEVEIAQISKVTKDDRDRKGNREDKINAIASGVAEMVYSVGASRFLLR